MPTRCNRCFLLQILLLAQHVSGTIMPIIRSSRVLYSWLLPVVFGALVFKLLVWCGAEGCVSGLRAAAYQQLENQSTNTTGSNQLYNTLQLLMMGIMVPETCWASNKICNKKHLLHLVGIYFHILMMMHGQNHFKCTLIYLVTEKCLQFFMHGYFMKLLSECERQNYDNISVQSYYMYITL